MARKPKGRIVTLGPQRRPFHCLACGGELFRYRDASMGDALGTPVTALICLTCGYVQVFADGMAELWDPPG